jgi:light-regulated signal transduction histidine kinase (bacteriophytochrome)
MSFSHHPHDAASSPNPYHDNDRLSALNSELKEDLKEHAAELLQLAAQLRERNLQLEQRTRELEERSAELEAANRQLESFSYSVSHDLRAPLRAVSGFAQILSHRHRESLNEQGRHFLDNIVEASAHMGRLIDDLLSYSRIGRSAIVMRPVGLSELLADIVRRLQPRIAEAGVTLAIANDLPVVQGDATLLSQVFTNLLDNALTYRKSGLPLQVSVAWKRSGNDVIVSVTDTGIGIAERHFDAIFNVFERLHTQDAFPGTGIGLAVVKKSVDMQGGAVWVTSSVGVGSTFHVRLALAQTGASTQKDRA